MLVINKYIKAFSDLKLHFEYNMMIEYNMIIDNQPT